MRGEIRRKIEMSTGALEFCRAHPSDDGSYATMLARLAERVARADALAVLERAGRIAERSGTSRREELRRDMHSQLLRHLVRVGEAAAKDRPELLGKFRLRMPNATHKAFLVSAKAMLADGIANKELFVSLGLSATMLDELANAVREFEEVSGSSRAGRTSHVGARADFETIAAELLEAVELLNTFNRRRFRNDSELAAAWESARNVLGPFRSKPAEPPTKGGVTPPSGGIETAA